MDGASSSVPAPGSSGSTRSSGSKLAKLVDFLECGICQQDLRNVHICGQCSQPFCRKCIVEWLAKERNCPHCRCPLTEQALVKARTFDQLGAVVDELLAAEERNRCHSHRREQLFFCFVCEDSICDRCMFEEVHLGHKDEIVLLDVAFDHFNKSASEDFEWIKTRARALTQHQDRFQKNKQLLAVEFERVDALIRQASESIASQYEQKLINQEQTYEIVEKHIFSISAILEKFIKLEPKEKTASALEQFITFKNDVKLLRSESSSIVETVDLCFENDITPSPIQIIFYLENYSTSIEKNGFGECSATGTKGFIWKLRLTPSSVNLLLEQGTPGAYWVACLGYPAKSYEFKPRKYVRISHVGSDVLILDGACEYHRSEDRLEMVVSIFQARSYAEQCQLQQDYIERLEEENCLLRRYVD